MPPELAPQSPRSFGSLLMIELLADLGKNLLHQKPGVVAAHSVVLMAPVVARQRIRLAAGTTPGGIMTAMVTGISFLNIRLSKTVLTFSPPPPSWKNITHAGFAESYCFGT